MRYEPFRKWRTRNRVTISLWTRLFSVTLIFAHWPEAAQAGQTSVYPQTAPEQAAGVTPVDRRYAAGDVRRYGATHNDGSDDTLAIQTALNVSAGEVPVSFQPGTYLIGRLEIPANSTIQLPAGCVLKDTGKLPGNKRLINITNDNVRILGRGARVEMSRKDYTSGEQRHGVFISGAANVYIEGLESSDSGGDGFYIGASARRPFSSDVQLVGVKADNNRRQGLSIVSARNVRVSDSSFTNTSGTPPSAGIDIEPNNNSQFIENVQLENIRTEGNDGAGITMYLNNLAGPVAKNVSVRIIDHVDKQSAVSFVMHKLDLKGHSMQGDIVLERPVSIESRTYAAAVRNYDARGPAISIIEPKAIRPNNSVRPLPVHGSAFAVFRDRKDTGAAEIGNVRFVDPTIQDDRPRPLTRRYFFVTDLHGRNGLRKVDIEGKITGTGIPDPGKMIQFDAAGVVEDSGRLLVQNATSRSHNLTPAAFARFVTNDGSKGPVSVRLPRATVGWPDVTFETRESQTFSVISDEQSRIAFPGGPIARRIDSRQPGSTVTLRRTAADRWTVVSISGDWGHSNR